MAISLALSQKIQVGRYFFRTTEEPSTKISMVSRSPMSRVRRNSIGSTIRPSSSILLTIPVDFIVRPPVLQMWARWPPPPALGLDYHTCPAFFNKFWQKMSGNFCMFFFCAAIYRGTAPAVQLEEEGDRAWQWRGSGREWWCYPWCSA